MGGNLATKGRTPIRTSKAACSVGGSETPRWGRSNPSLGKSPTPVREDGSLREGRTVRPCREKDCVVRKAGIPKSIPMPERFSAADRKCKDVNVVKCSSLEFDIIAHVNTAEETKVCVDCGDWRLDCEIGRGAYGVVYLATRLDGERAAVKVCCRSDVGDERYERELRGTKLYSSIPPQEGLIRMREFVEESWGFYAVMDLADDEFGVARTASSEYRPKTLARVIEGEKALPLGECVKLGIALAKCLVALQRHHLLHRDIKPGNVLYVGGLPVLSDPGLLVEESNAVSCVGTPGYVPPENFTDAAGDIYSLGLTLKAASFGRRIENLDKGPALEADTGAKLFPVWWRILNKATDPTPSRRYQSAKAILKELKRLHLRMALARFAWASQRNCVRRWQRCLLRWTLPDRPAGSISHNGKGG